MSVFLTFGNLLFSSQEIVWIDTAAFNNENVPAVEVKMRGDDQTWLLIGTDRDAVFDWVARTKTKIITKAFRFAMFDTKIFNVDHIRWVNLGAQDETGAVVEVATTDGTVWKLKDRDATEAIESKFFIATLEYA